MTFHGSSFFLKKRGTSEMSSMGHRINALWKIFFLSKFCRQNSVKASFIYQQRTAIATVFLNKVLTVYFLILFFYIQDQLFWRKHHTISLEFFLYWFYMFNLYNFSFQRLIWKIIPTPIPRIPNLFPRIPIIPLIRFPNSPFWLF